MDAGLIARVNIRCSDANPIDQVGQLDRLYRTNLNALAALDATAKKVLFIQRAGWPQPLFLRLDDRQEAGHCRTEYAAGQQYCSQDAAPARLSFGNRDGRRLIGCHLARWLVVALAHDRAILSGLMKRGFSSRRIRSGVLRGELRSREPAEAGWKGVSVGKISKETEAGSSVERGAVSSCGRSVGAAQDAIRLIVKIRSRIFCPTGLWLL